ncbi:hypothetical protein BH10PLA1_BH10PLA1_12540 [soil metagenome]
MTSKTRIILLSAVLATPLATFLSPRSADAQYRIDNGAALDANNRIGSGGTNEAHQVPINATNDVVTGNVTGGKQFRGNVPYSAAGAFHGNVSNVDRFVRSSSSAYDQNANSSRPFYGTGYGAPAPKGFTQTTNSSGEYIQAMPSVRSAGDVRLGVVTDQPMSQLPRAGELMLPGQIDTGNTQSLVTASPLYGVREGDRSSPLDNSSNGGFLNVDRGDVQNRLGVNDKSIQSMRDELRKNIVTNPNDASAISADPANLSSGLKMDKPFESPANAQFQSQPMNSSLDGTQMQSKISSDQSLRNALVPAPAEQSDQYAELSKRFKKLQSGPQTDQQIQSQVNADLMARQKAQALAKSGRAGYSPRTGGAGSSGGDMAPAAGGGGMDQAPATGGKSNVPETSVESPAQPKANTPDTVIKSEKPAETGPSMNAENKMIKPGTPLAVKSLTDGMKPGGLRDTLATAEAQMREGKYTSALDQYDLAERVAPNNPMITLGRAHAELGASYYARADSDIRRALATGPEMMLAQFNLEKFLGRDRVEFLEKDLKDIASTEPKSVRAPFLLAYMKYSTGDLKMASNYLALSEKRAGKADPLYQQLRIYWGLPAAVVIPDGEMNK